MYRFSSPRLRTLAAAAAVLLGACGDTAFSCLARNCL